MRPSAIVITRSARRTSSGRCAISSTVRPSPRRVDRLADELGALGVEVGGRLVEDHERRVAQERARERDAPRLARRQRPAAVADHRLVALGQRRDEAVRGRRARPPRARVRRRRPRRRGGCCRRPCRGRASTRCGTHASCARHAAASHAARSTPPAVTRPPVGSVSRSSSEAIVLLPAPLGADERDRLAGRELERDAVEHRRRGRGRRTRRPRAGSRSRPRRARAPVPALTAGGASTQVEQPARDRDPVGARVELRAHVAQRQVQLGREHEHRQRRPRSRCRRRRAARRP